MASEPGAAPQQSAWVGGDGRCVEGRGGKAALRFAAFAIVVILGCPGSPAAGDDEDIEGPVSVRVYPYVSPRPATVQLRIRLTPHRANRHLVVEVDSPSLFRSSLIRLDG